MNLEQVDKAYLENDRAYFSRVCREYFLVFSAGI